MQRTELPAHFEVVTPLTEVLTDGGGDLCLAMVRFAATQPGGVEAWLNRPMRDGYGNPVYRDTRPFVDDHELHSF